MKKLGKYELLGELGHGAMGVVYRARDPIINRLVALKTITTGVADDPALLQRFYREAQSAGGLQHPNIVTIYDMGEANDLPYIAMELVEGENLEQLIARRPALPMTLKLVYAMQACRAFDYAHKRGIVHRDIKPGNVMLSKDGTVKVVDFGIARVLEASRTQTGMLIGTFAYMSPEQYHGEHADERSDIWSLGVLLYELLSYERPFKGATPANLMHNICQENPSPLKSLVPECPDELENLITRVLQKSPNDRYQSMEDLLLELDPVCKKLQAQFVADLIEQSRMLLEQGEFSQARDLLRQALQVESSNLQGRALLERANAGIKRLQNRPNVESFINKGRTLLDQGKFEEARDAAQNALQLDSTFVPAQELRVAAEHEIEHARVRAETLESARQRLAEGLPEEAEVFLAKIFESEPANAQALALQEQVNAEKAERLKRERIQSGLKHARELWTQQAYTECIRVLTELEKDYPGEDEIARMLKSAREDLVEQEKQQSLLEARGLLADGRHDDCLALLGRLQKTYPGEEEISRLIEEARRDQIERRKSEKLNEARNLLATGQHDACIALLHAAIGEFPKEQEFSRLLESARQSQQEQRRQQGLAEARKHFAARRFDKCLAGLAALEQLVPGDADVQKLRQAVQDEQVEERKQRGLQEARNLLESKEYETLLKQLDRLEREFPGEQSVAELRDSARKEQTEQRKRESLAQARKFLAAKKYDEAIHLLQKLQSEFASDADIRAMLQATRDDQAEYRKQQGLGEARALIRANHYAEAIVLLEKLQADFPSEPEIRKQLAAAQDELKEREKQKKLSEGRNLLAAQSYQQAMALLSDLAAAYPKDSAVLKLLSLAQQEQEKFVRAQRIQHELDVLKKLIAEKKYPDVLVRTKTLLQEFPSETQFLRLAEFATAQQANIEKEALFRSTLSDAKSHYGAGRFEEAIRTAKNGLVTFPGNAELASVLQQAETQQRKLEVRQQIEMRIREIRVKINREKFSEAVDLAQETLVTLGPDTDLTQLLNSAQVEIQSREKKRKQEFTLATIRTLVDSGNFDGATKAVGEAIAANAIESFDPRIQRLSQEIEVARVRAAQKAAPSPAPAPPTILSPEYAFLEAPPAPAEPTPTTTNLSVEASATHAPSAPSPVAPQPPPAAAPLEVEVPTAQDLVPAPPSPAPATPTIAPTPKIVKEPRIQPVADAPILEQREVIKGTAVPEAEPKISEAVKKVEPVMPPPRVPAWRSPAAVGLGLVALVSGGWYLVHSLSSGPSTQQRQPSAVVAPAEPAAPPVNPLETQQREALNSANKMIAANDLNGAIQVLQQAEGLNGPLTAEIQRKQSEIAASLKDANLRQLRQNEEKIWQRAMNRSSEGQFTEAQKDLRQLLALPAGGVHREDAQNYLDKVIPQRIQQNGLRAQASQALKASDFQAARQAADQLKQSGGDPAGLLAEINQEEQGRLGQLEAQFDQLKQRDDDASIQQLRGLQSKFQALGADSGPQAAEASNYASAVPGAIADIQAGVQRKTADAAFQKTVQRYQQAVANNDKSALTSVKGELQAVIQGGGPHAGEAQRYRSDLDNKLAALSEPPATPVPPPAKIETPVKPAVDNDADVRAVIQRYGQAFEQRDADALRQIWPSMGSKYGRYKQIFDLASSIQEQVTIETVVIGAGGTTAQVKAKVFQSYTPKEAKTKPQQFDREFVFDLQKTSRGTWVLSDVK